MKPFDERGVFGPAADGPSLRRLAVRGAGFTVAGQSAGFAVQMIATIVLARLLTPADFGVVIMVTTFSLLFVNFGVNGFTEAVLQRESIDHRLASNLFWINLSAGAALAVAFAGAAPLLAAFYGDPRVVGVTRALSVTILVSSASVLHLALLKRAMRFPLVSTNDLLARLIAVLASVVLALAGWNYWALVGGAIALPLVTCIGAWTVCRWVPGPPRRDARTIPMIAFAMNTYGRFIASYLTWNLDNLLVGWRFGPAPLGFYKKAYDLFVLPVNQLSSPLTAVAVSSLSRLAGDPVQYRRYYLRALSILAFVGMGLATVLTLIGRDVILLLLGPRWTESGRIFTFFAPAIGVMLLYYTNNWIHLSIGRADRCFRWGVVDITVTASFFLAGLRWGPVGMAIAWVTSLWVLTIPGLSYAGRPVGLRIASVIEATWKYVVAGALAGVAAAAACETPNVAAALASIGVAGRIAIVSLLVGALYLSAVILLHRGCAPIRQVAAILRDMLPLPRLPRSVVASSNQPSAISIQQ